MSQLVAPSHTAADSIPLGRRITEIMLEKGSAYTISAMSKRLEINRETYRLMLKGEREIYTFELEKIAADLKVPVERILQQDIEAMYKQALDLLVYDSSDYNLGLQYAKQIYDVAIGVTERCMALNHIGVGYFYLRQYKQAIQVFEQALPEAKMVMDKYHDAELYWQMTGNIINVKTNTLDFQGVQDMLIEAETYFRDDPRAYAILCYHWAILLEEWKDDHEGARLKHYEALANYERTGKQISVARSKHLVALFEYRHQQYEKAIELFHEALMVFRQEKHVYFRVIIGRDYGRTLLRVDRPAEAAAYILESLAEVPDGELQDLAAQLYLLLAIATDQPQHAERVLEEQIGSISIQKVAGKFLVEYAERQGDTHAQQEAEWRLEQMLGSPIDLLLPIKSTQPGFLITLLDLCIQHLWQLGNTYL